MAKSQRASSRKRNNAALRRKVFGPPTDARTERLSAKLQEIATKPKPEPEQREMDVDEPEVAKEEDPASAEVEDEGMRIPVAASKWRPNELSDMGVDAQPSKSKTIKKSATSNKPSRVTKHRVVKPKKAKNNIIFADLQARKQKQKERRAKGKH
jgi:hypothetical protein